MNQTRRDFLKRSTLACAAFSIPWIDPARARAASASDPVLVSIFLRGAADGLNLVVPVGERRRYDALRPTIAVPDAQLLKLNNRFGLHPQLAPLHPLYGRGELALLHAVGSPHPTRSHFEAQDYMERAAPGSSGGDGWLNGTLSALKASEVVEGVGLGSQPVALAGTAPFVAARDLDSMRITGRLGARRRTVLEAFFARRTSGGMSRSTKNAFAASDLVAGLDRATTVAYPKGPFAQALKDAAALIKSSLGVRVVALELDGWDTHSAETNRLAAQATTFSEALAAFWEDLGPSARSRTVALAMTEFGRTAAENGSGGTDHGHGSVMFALGGNVRGGRVVADWPGIGAGDLYEGRDLKVTTDFRDVFAEVLDRHMGLGPADQRPIFPSRQVDPGRYPGVL